MLFRSAWTPSSDALYFLENQQAMTRLNKVELGSGQITPLPMEQFTHIEQISVSPEGEVALIAQSPEQPAEIWRLQGTDLKPVALNQPNLAGTGWAPQPQPVSWQSSDGATVYGTYYAPTNPNCTAEGLPPLIVYVHGGPTSQVSVGFSLDRLTRQLNLPTGNSHRALDDAIACKNLFCYTIPLIPRWEALTLGELIKFSNTKLR